MNDYGAYNITPQTVLDMLLELPNAHVSIDYWYQVLNSHECKDES